MTTTGQASHNELCDKALAHYEEISAAAHHWNSLVPRAIEFYKQHGDRASIAAPQGDAAGVLKVLTGRHHAEHHKQFPSESCPAWPCDILRAAASSQLPAEPPPEHYFIVTQIRDRCGYSGCELGPLDHPEIPKHNSPAEPRQEGEAPVVASAIAGEIVHLVQDEYEHGAASIEPKIAAIITRYLVGTPLPETKCRGRRMSEFFKSECGQYLCKSVRGGSWPYEAWTIDGCIHWRHDNRIRTTGDVEKYRHPMAYCVGGFSCQRSGQKKGSFTLDLLHCDTTKIIEPGKGNTVIESIEVVFRRKVPPQHVPKWLKSVVPAAPVVATDVEGELPIEDLERDHYRDHPPDEK